MLAFHLALCGVFKLPLHPTRIKRRVKNLDYNSAFKEMKIMASGPITSGKRDGETTEKVTDIFLASKITSDGVCSHEIKRGLLLGRKTMTNLGSILKSRDITCQ